jgi:hypothetical protein
MPAWTMLLEVPQADNAERDTVAGDGSSISFDNFQRQNTRIPTNFIADWAAEDGRREEL